MAKNITRLKDNWLVYMLLLIFVVLTYLICRCSWYAIDKLVKDIPSQASTQEVVKVQIEFSDSVVVKVDKVHKK